MKIKNSAPKVTVLLPTYNASRYFRQAIESVLNQTFKDFELLIVDDGSTDDTVEIAKTFGDPRIRIKENPENKGLVRGLNQGLDLARGEYIARMDQDDISLPDRLERQVDFLEKNQGIGICGTWIKIFSKYKFISLDIKKPLTSEEISCEMIFGNALLHPTVMMRKKFLDKFKLRYRDNYLWAEDYDLWRRACLFFPVVNLPIFGLLYRHHGSSIGKKYATVQVQSNRSIRQEQLSRLKVNLTSSEKLTYEQVCELSFIPSRRFLSDVQELFEKIVRANTESKIFDRNVLERKLDERWFAICSFSASLGPDLLKIFRSSNFGKDYHLSTYSGFSLKARSLVSPILRGRDRWFLKNLYQLIAKYA